MTKREYLERKRRHKRIMRIRMAIKIAIYIIFALLVTGLVWAVAKPLVNKLSGDKDPQIESQVGDDAQNVTSEDALSGDGETDITEPNAFGQEDETADPDAAGQEDGTTDPDAAGQADETAGSDTAESEDAEADGENQADDSENTISDEAAANTAESWKVDEQGWSYVKADGTTCANEWQTIDGVEYYFNEQGYMATGWVDIGENSHYFRADGTEDKEAHQKLVAVTYDDGPSAQTERLLDILETYDVKATFFVVGEQAEYYTDTLKREDALGMEIGSHTYDHTYLYQVSGEEIQTTMNKNEEVLKSIIGRGSEIMRPTGGGINDTVRANINKPMINWDVDTLDWKSRDAESVAQIVREQVQDGSIILMHDLYESTVDASEMIIPELIEQGYKLVTVSELAERRGVVLQAAEEYLAFYPEKKTEEE